MFIRRIVGLAVAGFTASMVVGAIAAVSAKQRIVPTTDESADEIVAASIFGPLAFRSTAQRFRGGSVECWYGGGVLDLRDAVLAPEGATLKVRAIFGGGQVLVPPSWKVVTRVRGIGGIGDARPAMGFAADAPELTIEGIVLFGGFGVTSELAEGEAKWLGEMATKQDDKPGSEPEAAPVTEPEMAPAT